MKWIIAKNWPKLKVLSLSVMLKKTANEIHLLTELMSQESYMNLIDSDRDFKKLSQDMEETYKCALTEDFVSKLTISAGTDW